MAEESVDSGLPSEQLQASRSKYRPQFPLSPHSQHISTTRSQHSPLSSSYTNRNPVQTYAVVNSEDHRMSTSGGISSNNNNNGQNPSPSTTAAAATQFSRFPSHLQHVSPRVHFGDTLGRHRFRQAPDSNRVRAPPPFVRSFSSKTFEVSDGLSHSSLPRPSSPQPDLVHQHRDVLLDKGTQCERETGIPSKTQTHSNPLLTALLAAANATVNCPSGSSELDPTSRRRPQFRAGALPYWSDSEVNAYDSLDTFNVAQQNSIGVVGGGKGYPSANVVAAAATAAAMALAAVQSTSRSPPTKPVDAPLGTPISMANVHLDDLSIGAAAMRSLTGQFADTSLYSRFPTNVDQRKSVNFDPTLLHKQDIYGTSGVDLSQFPPQTQQPTSLMDKNHQRMNLVPQYFQELPGGHLRYSLGEESSMFQQSHILPDTSVVSNQERGLPSGSVGSISCTGPTIPRPQLPSSLNSSQFNLLCSEPYPSPNQPHPPIVQRHSPIHESSSPSTRYRGPANADGGGGECASNSGGGGLLVVNIIAGSGLKTPQMLLRDLYCVLETDSVRKARSMIRTNTDYFEWDEVFEVEIEECRFLSILIYQWDAHTRHRLCFYGGIDLTGLSQQTFNDSASKEPEVVEGTGNECRPLTSPLIERAGMHFEKIALQLEPRGMLYLQLGYLPMNVLYMRRNLSTAYETAFFGVSLDELMYRNRMLSSLGVISDPVVPLLIRKCVEEVDRRGTEVVGIYRLSGSVWMKLQVRDLFTRTAEKIAQALVKRNEKALRGAIAALDISADVVPDIHAITATLKDFFRELPEPLFTNALYPMVYEATQVAGPGDSHMGTKLILNILDCLPTSNQEVLLYLLDHLKRITSKSMVNKMNSHNLAICLAPCLLYPSPSAARDMDASLLEHSKMVSILECILDIWP
uniref:Rho-GAP domain-containing protein n=1 Tax=Mesocestoides corti TaxID=53468 RepID=A0A5K3F4J8_MESCO